MRALLIVALVVLVATGAGAARDCLGPLGANAGWSCHAELSNGASQDFCAELTNIFGDDPASRFFKITSTGGYTSTCSCQAKGKLAFGADAAYVCADRETRIVVAATVSKRKITGQNFNVSAGVRATFSCEPDPSCDVQPVVDVDLPPEVGSAALPAGMQVGRSARAGGTIDIDYLPGCSGYATEAPTIVFDVEAEAAGNLNFFFVPDGANFVLGGLVVTPSGEAHCHPTTVDLPVVERGSYRVWIPSETPGAVLQGKVLSTYRVN